VTAWRVLLIDTAERRRARVVDASWSRRYRFELELAEAAS
jgi:hypothetical protein